MAEGYGRLLRRLSGILVGAGLAAWVGGIGLAGQTRVASPSSIEQVPEPISSAMPAPRLSSPDPMDAPRPIAVPSPPVSAGTAEEDPPLRLGIPAIQLDAPVIPVGLTTIREGEQEWITWAPPDEFAAGWLITSAYPGQPGNVVLIGHHNIYGKVFANLHRLRPGDLIRLETRRQTYFYQVEAMHILPEKDQPLEVRQRNLQWVLPTPGERLTLVTCWPAHTNTHRLIVVARPVKP